MKIKESAENYLEAILMIKNKKGLTIANQVIRSGTSIGANINEANIAIAIPPEAAVKPPVKIPNNPYSFVAIIVPLLSLSLYNNNDIY